MSFSEYPMRFTTQQSNNHWGRMSVLRDVGIKPAAVRMPLGETRSFGRSNHPIPFTVTSNYNDKPLRVLSPQPDNSLGRTIVDQNAAPGESLRFKPGNATLCEGTREQPTFWFGSIPPSSPLPGKLPAEFGAVGRGELQAEQRSPSAKNSSLLARFFPNLQNHTNEQDEQKNKQSLGKGQPHMTGLQFLNLCGSLSDSPDQPRAKSNFRSASSTPHMSGEQFVNLFKAASNETLSFDETESVANGRPITEHGYPSQAVYPKEDNSPTSSVWSQNSITECGTASEGYSSEQGRDWMSDTTPTTIGDQSPTFSISNSSVCDSVSTNPDPQYTELSLKIHRELILLAIRRMRMTNPEIFGHLPKLPSQTILQPYHHIAPTRHPFLPPHSNANPALDFPCDTFPSVPTKVHQLLSPDCPLLVQPPPFIPLPLPPLLPQVHEQVPRDLGEFLPFRPAVDNQIHSPFNTPRRVDPIQGRIYADVPDYLIALEFRAEDTHGDDSAPVLSDQPDLNSQNHYLRMAEGNYAPSQESLAVTNRSETPSDMACQSETESDDDKIEDNSYIVTDLLGVKAERERELEQKKTQAREWLEEFCPTIPSHSVRSIDSDKEDSDDEIEVVVGTEPIGPSFSLAAFKAKEQQLKKEREVKKEIVQKRDRELAALEAAQMSTVLSGY
ncbi:hypothetical protein VKT23_009817 [Stygiomarasmius scandens]|uniref:Uncharacterized protein n=1 Tax=Marasmiellus scandens TaxID=2682957 RepID=A0ABR1JFV3_9AGAR